VHPVVNSHCKIDRFKLERRSHELNFDFVQCRLQKFKNVVLHLRANLNIKYGVFNAGDNNWYNSANTFYTTEGRGHAGQSGRSYGAGQPTNYGKRLEGEIVRCYVMVIKEWRSGTYLCSKMFFILQRRLAEGYEQTLQRC
jgi:hypothetical protein